MQAIGDILSDEKQAAIRTAVAPLQPLRIVLFGSRARGDHKPHSDWDFLIVLPDGSTREALQTLMTNAQRGIFRAIAQDVNLDVLYTTPYQITAALEHPFNVVRFALQEGLDI